MPRAMTFGEPKVLSAELHSHKAELVDPYVVTAFMVVNDLSLSSLSPL